MRARELVTFVRDRGLPATWEVRNSRALDGHAALARLLDADDPPAVYGANRLVGHLDGHALDAGDIDRFQHHLIDSHRIGGPPWMSAWQARCVSYAKLASLNAGGSTVSSALYEQILRCAVAAEFEPEIPANASYSAGDVIPAAHWAHGVVDYGDYLERGSLGAKEGLSLINGCFVHVGHALSLVPQMERLVINSVGVSRLFADVTGCGPWAGHWRVVDPEDGQLAACWRFLGHEHSRVPTDRQESVSVRAAPQVADALLTAWTGFLRELNSQLLRPADNPLMAVDSPAAVSQASFLAPRLTMAPPALIETLLFAAWSNVQRAQYLLSGAVPMIPSQAAEGTRPLGLIQVPKRMMAELEAMRIDVGRRAFASGASTSEGIEDLWSHGLTVSRQLEKAVSAGESILALEAALLAWCEARFTHTAYAPEGVAGAAESGDVRAAMEAAGDALLCQPFPAAAEFAARLTAET